MVEGLIALTPRQRVFVTEYVVDHNATQAAIRAGYSVRRAKQQGWHLLRERTEVAQAIGKLDEGRRERLGVSADWVVAELVAVYQKAFKGAPRTDRDER